MALARFQESAYISHNLNACPVFFYFIINYLLSMETGSP